MSIDVGKSIYTILLIVIFLSVAAGMYPIFADLVTNITGSGWVGTSILAVGSVIYWIIVGAVTILGLVEGLGLQKLSRGFARMK